MPVVCVASLHRCGACTTQVTLGVGGTIDETGIEPVETQSQREAREEAANKPKPIDRGNEPLVPWIELKK